MLYFIWCYFFINVFHFFIKIYVGYKVSNINFNCLFCLFYYSIRYFTTTLIKHIKSNACIMVRSSLFNFFNFCIVISFLDYFLLTSIASIVLTLLTNSSYAASLTTSLCTTFLSIFKSVETFFNLSIRF